ncbi:hypothetical protein Tco_1535228 [Tanacetum coccineum]
MIVIEIYSETDEESSPVEKKEKIKMVLTKKYLKKKGKLVVEDSKITKKDLRKKRKMVVLINEDEELTNEDDREYFKSKKFQSIENIGNLSLSAGQNITVNAPVESIVNAIVESTVNVVPMLP